MENCSKAFYTYIWQWVLVSFLGLLSPLLNHFTNVILTVFLTSLQVALVILEVKQTNPELKCTLANKKLCKYPGISSQTFGMIHNVITRGHYVWHLSLDTSYQLVEVIRLMTCNEQFLRSNALWQVKWKYFQQRKIFPATPSWNLTKNAISWTSVWAATHSKLEQQWNTAYWKNKMVCGNIYHINEKNL